MSRRTAWGLDTPHADHWENRAACREVDPEIFFKPRGSAADTPEAQEAKRICRGCPVIRECGTYALRHGVEFGVWGGLTERERRALTKRVRAA